MKTTRCPGWMALFVATLLPFVALAQGAAKTTGFKVVDAKQECVWYDQQERKPLEVGTHYPFGVTVETGRNASLDLELSAGNVFRLLARTKITISQDIRDPRLKVLRLDHGSVSLHLDNLPKGEKIQVETPTAVCGAVGTRFAVTFEADDDDKARGTRQSSFSCDQGAVFVASRFTIKEQVVTGSSMNVASLPAGSAFQAVIHEGLQNTYSDITVNRGRLTFQYGGDKGSTFVVAPEADDKPTRFIAAMEKSPGPVTMAAVEVRSGTVESQKKTRFLFRETVESTPISAEAGAVLVSQQEVKQEEVAEGQAPLARDYLVAAAHEGKLHSELVELERQGAPAADIAAKRVEATAAADQATALRQQLLVRRSIRLLDTIRRPGGGRAPGIRR